MRPYLPYLIIGSLVVYVVIIAPALVSLFIDDFLAFILSQVAVALVELILFMFFFYIIIIPITDTLRDIQVGRLEIFLAAPIKPSDVLLGEFLGFSPFYAVAFTVIAGFFTAALNPLGLDFLQIALIVIVFAVTFFSALWIGTVIAAILQTKFGKSTRGKDIGRALGVIIALPMIALMYALMSGQLLEVLANPGTHGMVRTLLSFLPSSWGAELIVGFASNPGNISAVGFLTLTRFGGLLAFFITILWLGVKSADSAYSLEPVTFTASKAAPDSVFYNMVKSLGGGRSFGTLLVTILKNYSRRLENLSWLVYIICLMVFLNIFFADPYTGPTDPLMKLSFMMIPMLTGLVVGTVSRGKETFFIYKKSPSGIGKFLKARFLHGCLIAVPITVVVMAISTLLIPQVTLISLLTNLLMASLRTMANVTLFLALALVIPSFEEKSRARIFSIMVNLQIVVFATLGLEIGFYRFGLSYKTIFPYMDPLIGLLYDHLMQTAIISLVGLALLIVGKRKLSRTE